MNHSQIGRGGHGGHGGHGGRGGRGFGYGQGFIPYYGYGYPYDYAPIYNIVDPLYADDDDLGEEERELARSCGAEEDALMRRTLNGIPHNDYRVLVVAAARKLAKNPRNPTTRDYALAKTKIDDELVRRGLSVVVPHARPGRVTR